MDRVSIKAQAKENFKANYGLVLGATVLYALLIGISSNLAIVGLIIGGPLTVGYYAFLCSVYRNSSDLKFEDMFSGFSNFGNNLVAYLLEAVFVFLWSLLFFIPGIIKTYSYAMTLYIMKDNPDMDGYDAIQKSRKMMDGHKWDLFVMSLSFLGWDILSVFTFGLLEIFYVAPYKAVALAGFYEELVAEEQAANSEYTENTEFNGNVEN